MVTYLNSHAVSADYVFWRHDEESIRAFLVATNRAMTVWFDERWSDAVSRADSIFDPEIHDEGLTAELFEDMVGVWPEDYFWQLSSAVIKDACAAYEVFLERIANSVLTRFGGSLATLSTEDSWRWSESQLFFDHYIGVNIRPAPVDSVLWMRNKMTHLRSTLRTPGGMAEFVTHLKSLAIDGPETSEEAALGLADHHRFFTRGVELTQLQTVRVLDVLADHVGTVAKAVFPYDHGGASNSYLAAVGAGSPRPISHFPTRKLIVVR